MYQNKACLPKNYNYKTATIIAAKISWKTMFGPMHTSGDQTMAIRREHQLSLHTHIKLNDEATAPPSQ